MQRGLGVVLAVAIGSAACASLRDQPRFVTPPPSPKGHATDPAQDPMLRSIWIAANEALIVEACPASEGSTPSTYVAVLRPWITITRSCGLVSDELYAPASVARFARDVCGITDGTMPEDCNTRFTDMVRARMAERYRGADWTEVDRTCRAYPLACQDARGFERIALASHNTDVERWYQRTAADVIERWREEWQRAAEEAARAAAQRKREEELRRNFVIYQSNEDRWATWNHHHDVYVPAHADDRSLPSRRALRW